MINKTNQKSPTKSGALSNTLADFFSKEQINKLYNGKKAHTKRTPKNNKDVAVLDEDTIQVQNQGGMRISSEG